MSTTLNNSCECGAQVKFRGLDEYGFEVTYPDKTEYVPFGNGVASRCANYPNCLIKAMRQNLLSKDGKK